SMLVKIIDFLLLKDYKNGGFLSGERFSHYEFFLEIKLNKGGYVTIKRSLKDIKHVAFVKHKDRNQNFNGYADWEVYPIYGTAKGVTYGIDVLQEMLAFDVFQDNKYRKVLGYFLRRQEDYSNPFQLQKNIRNKDNVWKPILFELLGYNQKLLDNIYAVTEKIKRISDEISILKSKYQIDDSGLDAIRNQKELLEGNIDELSGRVEKFDFYMKEAQISKELIDNIERQIANYNMQIYNLKSEIKMINESLQDSETYSYDNVFELFNDVKLFFPEQLKHSYEELIDFNNKIITERTNILHEKLKEKEVLVVEIDENLKRLNTKRMESLGKLQQVETFQKFKDSHAEIAMLNSNLAEVNKKIEMIESIIGKRRERDSEKAQLSILKEELSKLVENSTERGIHIKSMFAKYFKEIVGEDVRLVFALPKSDDAANINFEIKTFDNRGNETQRGEGYTYKKEICACMDLAILMSYLDKSFFRFVLHDGILDGDDRRIASAYLDLVRRLCDDGIQCIITMIDSVVPLNEDGSKYQLQSGELVLELNDNPDGHGTLFGFKF
ncbi:MAG: DUF2326 domain-containing protein, partial [Lachnospiraceae bacterium]|nr:DUF2326 domain-containing protein [Lachnospiraceae bacterium]